MFQILEVKIIISEFFLSSFLFLPVHWFYSRDRYFFLTAGKKIVASSNLHPDR